MVYMLFLGLCLFKVKRARVRMGQVSMLLREGRFFSVDFVNCFVDVALRIVAYFGGWREES